MKSKTYSAWLLAGDRNDSNSKVVDVLELFPSHEEAEQAGRDAVKNRPEVIDYRIGEGY